MTRAVLKVLVTAALLTLIVAGCAYGGRSEGVAKPCDNDKQCPSGEICVDIGCVSPNQDLVVQVIPPPALANALAAQDFANVDDSKDIDLQLGPLATLNLTSSLFPLTVTLTGTPLHIPDVPYVLPTLPTVSIATQLSVSPGNYQLLATPTDGITPPIEATAVLDAPSSSLDLPLQFHTSDELVRIDGTLTGPPALFGSTPLSYSLEMLHADGTPASQSALAGAPDGGDAGYATNSLGFSLYVAPTSSTGETLQLTASPLSGIGPSVSFTGTLDRLRALATASDGGLSLGTATPKAASGLVVDPTGNPVAGASVKLLASLPGQASFASTPVTTDDGGIFRTTCLHDASSELGESYQVQVVPPAGSHLAVLQSVPTPNWNGEQPANFGTVTVTTLTDVTGRVLDNTGSAVPAASVQATPTSDNVVPLTSASTTTDASGTYHLALSPGLYHFDFAPPLTLQAPSASRGPITVEGASTQLHDLQFSPARVVSGKVTGPDGSALNGAQIRVFFVLDGASSSTLLARGQSLPDGSFTVVLPAPSMSGN